MCTFITSLPSKSKSAGTNTNPNLQLFLKSCPDTATEKTWYRFRILAFSAPEKSDRDYPFIERYVHQVWNKNDKGYNVVVDEITCPVTRWVKFEGNRYEGCPICRVANQYFNTFKESNWKDREANKKQQIYGRKYEAIVPVYVVNDPNYAGNNGRLKVLIFNDREFYKEFQEKIKKASAKACVFNGKNAVDCCIHVKDEEIVYNEGQPNEYTYTKRVIDKVTFSSKPYDIPSITKENVENMKFDETYYVSNTLEELNAFYNKYFKISNDDIPDEDDLTEEVYTPKVEKPKKVESVKTNKVVQTPVENDIDDSDDTSVDDLNDLISDDEDINDVDIKTDEPSDDSDTDDLDAILKDLDI